MTISGLILENLTAEEWRKSLGNVPLKSDSTAAASENLSDPMTDTSLRRFKRGTVLRYGFEVYNAKLDAARKPDLTAQIKVFRDGKTLLEGKNVPVDTAGQTDLERIKSVGAINLGTEMTAGEYILQIIVNDNSAKDKRRLATQFVQFEIE